MTDVIEGMARAMWLSVNQHCTPDALGKWEEVSEVSKGYWRTSAQAALDYLKQPQTASKPTSSGPTTQTVSYARYDVTNLVPARPLEDAIPEGQGPEMTQEQVGVMKQRQPTILEHPCATPEFKAIWQPIVDVLRGDAP